MKKLLEYMKNKKGAIGIGTLIVFIAMVLVAAVAASVLINTSGFLQQKASSTGRQSTEQVASGLYCSGVTGHVFRFNGKYYDLDRMVMYVTPNAGSAPIDLKEAKLFLTHNGKSVVLKYNNTIEATTGTEDIFELKNYGVINFTEDDYPTTGIVAKDNDGNGGGKDIIEITTNNHKLMALLKQFNGISVTIKSNNSNINANGGTGTLYITSYDDNNMIVQIIDESNSSVTADNNFGSSDWLYIKSNEATWGGADDKQFLVVPLQDNDKSVIESAVINKGDIVAILINVEAAFGNDIPERAEITGKLQPEFGAPAILDVTTPAAYTSEIIELQ
ncbi:flagellin [Methanofervidicoccus sp. A16]|nr:flagellin [Methanofervidicoccus sp. A16]